MSRQVCFGSAALKSGKRLALLLLVAAAANVNAQSEAPPREPPSHQQAETKPPQAPNEPPAIALDKKPEQHRFFHKENKWLFAGVAMARSADFASTKNFRSRGRDEIFLNNDVVDNTPAFVAIQAGAVVTSVGLSYLFHRTGHHKLERWVSILHISVTGFGATRNFMLKSRQPTPGTP